MKYYEKHITKNLSDHLTLKEFACRCSRLTCAYCLVFDSIPKCFEATRKDYGHPIAVTSGHRCQAHNLEVGGVPNSFHTLGGAIDMKPHGINRDEEEQLYNHYLDKLEVAARNHFEFVLRYKTFIHAHNKE